MYVFSCWVIFDVRDIHPDKLIICIYGHILKWYSNHENSGADWSSTHVITINCFLTAGLNSDKTYCFIFQCNYW